LQLQQQNLAAIAGWTDSSLLLYTVSKASGAVSMETKVVVVKNVDDDDDDVDDRPRTPIVTGPIIELRGREVLFAISVFFLTAIVVGLIVVLASNKVI